MSDTEQSALVPGDATMIMLLPRSRYGDDLALGGLAADHASRTDTFAEYHAEQTDNTRAAQLDALKCFSTYLAKASIERLADDLYQDAEAWRGMSVGLLKGFRKWLLEQASPS